MVTTTKPRRTRTRRDDAAPDTGCSVWSQCVSCPWATCIAELPASEHTTFVAALKLVTRYLPAEGRILPDR
jgi:hypothetical protein